MKSNKITEFREQICDIQSILSKFYVTIQKVLSEMRTKEEEKEFLQMKNIDLCKALKGTIFNTQLNKLCDIKQIIDNIEIGFASLQCDFCDKQATIVCEGNQEKLYCEPHFEKFGSISKTSTILMHSLRFNRIVLKELERQLIRLQERIDYFHIQNDQKDYILYEKIRGFIDESFEELKILLESMTAKCLRINQSKSLTISSKDKLKYESLSFVKDDCDKCRSTIFKILSMIPEVCDKIESESLVQMIVDSTRGVPLEEEIKEDVTASIPDHIYGKRYQLVSIPTQSLSLF